MSKESMIDSTQGENGANIKYWLQKIPSPVANKKTAYAARAYIRSCGLMAIAEQMKREGSKYDPHEVVSILQQFFDVVIDRLKQGYSVNVGSMLHFRPSIKGSFAEKDEAFNSAKHQILVSVNEGRRLREALLNERAELVEMQVRPELTMVDVNMESSGAFLHVKGYHLYDSEGNARWFVRVNKKVTEIAPLFVKKNGREAMLSLPIAKYPKGTTISLLLRYYKGKNNFVEYTYPEAITL